MAIAGEPRALIVGDDGDERRRIMSWFPRGWTAVDGGAPATAVDRATGEPFGVVVYTAATDSVDLGTWHQALSLSGFGGLVIDTRVGGALPPGVTRVTNPHGLAEILAG